MFSISDVVKTQGQDNALTILYEDEALIAVDKPPGLLVHRSNIDRHETQYLVQTLRDQIGAHVFPVQRLDKPTSGVIIFAKTPAVAALLQTQIMGDGKDRSAHKEYLLVCRGYTPPLGIIDHSLKPIDDFKHPGAQVAAAKPAVTEFTRLHTIELPVAIDKYSTSRYSLVKANLKTGRKHQLRRHFKHLSHPIIGCPKYGKSLHNRYFAEQLNVPRLLLHAHRLQFKHPLSLNPVAIVAPLTGAFAELLKRFEWHIDPY